MEKAKAIELLNKALGCVQTDPRNCGECKKCENYATKEDGIEAIRMAISALEGKDIDVPTNSALDHIHNVVSEREYQRGYKQAKEKYDHKLTEIKSRFKDRYYNKGYSEGYEQGKADAEKEMHDNILRYRMPEPWEGE